MSDSKALKPSFYTALFLVTMSTLLYQMLLTRIFSVTMWYHFAFVAVSLAMFGMTASAVAVFIFKDFFSEDTVHLQIARASLLYSVTMIFALLTQLAIPFRVAGLVGKYSLFLTYTVSSIPFFMSGVVVCLVLTRFQEKVNRLYAIDLLGAGVGCMLFIPFLGVLDGPTAVVASAALTAFGAYLFARSTDSRLLRRASVIWGVLCLVFVFWHTGRVREQKPVLSIMWVKGSASLPVLYEKWNAFSCVRTHNLVVDDANGRESFKNQFGEGTPPQAIGMNIDAAGGTPITAFDGDLSKVNFLKKYVPNLAHYLRPDSQVYVIGTGGGVDVLSSLVFNQKKIVGVDINGVIIDTLNKRFGDFSGHLDRIPNVSFINAEGRSYIIGSQEKFDLIVASLIDTWAAGASGAFALSENSLYTVEAWTEYLKHLTPRGVVSFNRWYFAEFPDEMYRLTGLAVEALHRTGVKDVRSHLVIVTPKMLNGETTTTGTLLVSKEPFTAEDLQQIEALSREVPFDVRLSPAYSVDKNFEKIASGEDLKEFYRTFPSEITPSTDDNPFFFHRFKLRDVLSLFKSEMPAYADINSKGVVVLAVLLSTVLVLLLGTVIFPLFMKTRSLDLASNARFLVFFGSIGVAFMMVEVSQLQRLSIFLGHPSYSLSVVLFSLLIGSGLGSWMSEWFSGSERPVVRLLPFLFLLGAVGAFGILTPFVIQKFWAAEIMVKIMVSAAILLPLGMTMGMPFPSGMKLVLERPDAPAAWFWGINGAASVCASVLSIAVALTWGISTSFWVGGVFYLAAALAFAGELFQSKRAA